MGREFDSEVCLGLGLALAKSGNRDGSIVWLRRGLALAGDSP